MKAFSKKKDQLLLDISLIFFTFVSTSIFAKNNFPESRVFDCKVLDELENSVPALKRNYEKKNINLFLNYKLKWLNEIKKGEWLVAEKNNLSNIEIDFIVKGSKVFFSYKRFFSNKKTNLDLEYNVMIDTIDNSFSFPKYYYTRNNELFFSSELRGICNIEKEKK